MPRLVVEMFVCEGAGPDCPQQGFEVTEAEGVLGVVPSTFLLDHDLEALQAKGVEVLVKEPTFEPHDLWDDMA